MSDLQPIHFDLANVDIIIAPPPNLPLAANALLENKPFPDAAFSDGAIPFGALKASAGGDIKLDRVKFAASGGVFAGVGVYRSPAKLFDALKAEGLNEPLIGALEFPDLASKNLYALRWGYNAEGAVSGKVALGVGISFGASGRREALYAVLRTHERGAKAFDAMTETVNSWRMPRQIAAPDDAEIKPGTWLIAETDGAVKFSLGVQYGYDYSWVREAVKIGALSGDFGMKIEMGVKAALGFNASGRYATVLSRPNAERKLRLQIFKVRQQGWSFAFDAAISAQIRQDVVPENFEEFIKGVFNLNGLQILKDLEKWLDPDTTLADLFGAEMVDYAEKFVKDVTGFDAAANFDKAIKPLRDVIKLWRNLPHEAASLLYGLLDEAAPLADLKRFLKRVVELTDPNELSDEILGNLKNAAFFATAAGRWLNAVAERGILSLLSNIADERERFAAVAQKTLELLDGATLERTLKNLQKRIAEKLGLAEIFKVVNETDFADLDAWLKKRLSDFLGKTVVFRELEEIKKGIGVLRENGREFYQKGFEILTEKYRADFHGAFQKTTNKTALIDVTFDFAADAANARTQLKKALGGDFAEIFAEQIAGVQLNQGVLTHGITRSTHLEIKLPYFSRVLDHINKSVAEGKVVDAADGRLWAFSLKAQDTVKKKNSVSKLSIALAIGRNVGIRQFGAERFRYDYSLLTVKRAAKREYLEERLGNLVEQYLGAEFGGAGGERFSSYLTALDKTLDERGIGGDNFFGDVLTRFSVSLPGRVSAAWKNAPKEKNHPIYMAISRRVQTALRRFIPLCYLQDPDQYKELPVIYPLLAYSALPPMNKVKLTADGLLKFTEDELYWDSTDVDLRRAIFSQRCAPQLRDAILPRVQNLLSEMPNTRAEYGAEDIGKILALSLPGADLRFNSLIFQEREIIEGIVKSGRRFRQFLDARELEEAIEELAKFGATLTDAFNENITSLYKGSLLRPLGTLLLLEVAELLDPNLSDQIKPAAMLDLYVLKPDASFAAESFLIGARPKNEELAIHQSIVSTGDAGV